MISTINLSGFISSIGIEPDEFMLPLHEVVVNAIQSIEDVEDSQNGTISINVIRGDQTSFKEGGFEVPYKPIKGFEVTDNGIGFTQKRFKAFDEVYTDINKKKGCKGIGRYTVLACFGSMDIDSTYFEAGKWLNRSFNYSAQKGIVPSGADSLSDAKEKRRCTKITLNNYLKSFSEYIVSKRIELKDIADSIIHHCLLYFTSGNVPIIRIYDDDNPEKPLIINDVFKEIIKFDKEDKAVKIVGIEDDFSLNYIRNYTNRAHSVHLCANKREVGTKLTLSGYIPSFVNPLQDGDSKYFLSIYVTGKYLDDKVNEQRTKFLIPQRMEDKKNGFDSISMAELFENISSNIKNEYSTVIEEAEKERDERVRTYIMDEKKPRLVYRHLLGIDNIFDDIPANATVEKIEADLHKIAYQLEQKRTKAFDKAFAKKQYDKEAFSDIIKNVLKEEARFSADKLADLVVKRKAVIKLFKQYLEWRSEENYMLEEDLHNIIFTMGAESDKMPCEYHNLWLLDERLAFHRQTTSDKQLRTNRHIELDSPKEPDLLIYDFPWAYTDNPNAVNSLVVFEFKRPGRDMNTRNDRKLDSQVEEYFEKLMESKAVSDKGRFLKIQDTTPKFGYVICDLHKDLVEYNHKFNGFEPTPYGSLYKINSNLNLYIEVMSYETMVDFAEKRHDAFFQALGIDNL